MKNSSYRKNIDLEKTKETIINQFNKMFGEGFSIELTVIGKNDEVANDQHLIDIVSPAEFGYEDGKETLGDANYGGKYIRVSSNYLNDKGQPGKDDQGTFSEEIGHSGGLSHPFEFDKKKEFANGNQVPTSLQSQGLDPTTNNFMNYPWKAAGAIRDAKGISLSRENQYYINRDYSKNPSPATNGQKSQILENYRNKNLNFNDIPRKHR